ncbi:MAG: hypothetical protein KJN90_04585 [Gammaproteobacteria bacterium]|nr:hypothetical protein [Gammaproteobacteria bacterium]
MCLASSLTRSAGLVLLLVLTPTVCAQQYQPSRTPDGKPDLQGNWSNASITTLERNTRYQNLVLSTDEVMRATQEHPQNVRLETDDNLVPGELLDGSDLARGRGYNAFWIDPGTNFGNISGEYRTSWIVDPPDGRIPYSEPGLAYRAALRQKNSSFDGPESRPLAERCISTNMRVGPPMINGLYNNYYQIVQTPDYVMIRTEMVSHARIVPIGKKHRMAIQAPMFGESVGYWDGDTLVVETTNFHPLQEETSISLSHDARVQERFTRTSDDQIVYEFTIDDPDFYSQPWRGEVSFRNVPEAVYEFACHEGNYALSGILAGARRAELEAE